MKVYFPKKAKYNEKEIFDRAYYANFSAIDKAVHKFKQKSAMQKQGQNLKKISETSNELKEQLTELNGEQGNLRGVSQTLMESLITKLTELEAQMMYKDRIRTEEDEEDQSDEDDDDIESSEEQESQQEGRGFTTKVEKVMKQKYEPMITEDR